MGRRGWIIGGGDFGNVGMFWLGEGGSADEEAAGPSKPLVQFSISMYYATKDEGLMKFDVCKLGDPARECKVTGF